MDNAIYPMPSVVVSTPLSSNITIACLYGFARSVLFDLALLPTWTSRPMIRPVTSKLVINIAAAAMGENGSQDLEFAARPPQITVSEKVMAGTMIT